MYPIPPSTIAVSFRYAPVWRVVCNSKVRKKNKLNYKRVETQETSHKILAYLMDNPDAQDTFEGIVDWWLLQQDIKRNVTLIRKTVDELIHEGFLLERQGNSGTKYYQVNRERLPEISVLIQNGWSCRQIGINRKGGQNALDNCCCASGSLVTRIG